MAIALKSRRDAPQPEALPPRAPMQAEPIWLVDPSGLRRLGGARWRDMISLEVANAQAWMRHKARHAAKPEADRPAFVAPFTPTQISVARSYRDLVEWREGSVIRGSDLSGSTGGNGAGGLFIDSYIANGDWLAELKARIGDVVVMDVRRHMDRGNARRPITARVAVDQAVLSGAMLSNILTHHGWAASTLHLKELRAGLCAALDRMCGPTHTGVQVWKDEAVVAQQKGY